VKFSALGGPTLDPIEELLINDRWIKSRESHRRGHTTRKFFGRRLRQLRAGAFRTELITDKKIIRELRRKAAPMVRLKKTPILSSPVNRLFGALIRYFAKRSTGRGCTPL